MKEYWLKLKEAFLARWNKLDKKQRWMLAGGAVLILLVAVLLTVMASRPRFVPLYTNLEQQDAAAITQQLKDKKVQYRLSDNGQTVLVPEAQKDELRLELAAQGLPKGGSVGFESLNQTRFGETESERKARYLIALQGELERTIRKLDAVDDVRVHIVAPEPSLFLDQQKDATAAVLLRLKPGQTLQDDQVAAIMHLVASGVEGLKPENVTVVDTQGNMLSEGLNNPSSRPKLTANQLQLTREYESQLEKAVQSMLERVVGQGKVIVRANATLSFDQVEINKETYGDKQIRSRQESTETSNGNNANPQGVPGAAGNIPQYAQPGGQAGAAPYQKTDKTTNYEVDKTSEHRIVAPGQVQQLSLAVLVDGQLDPQEQGNIQNLAAAAAGINPARGDSLTVTSMPFNNALSRQMAQEMAAARRRALLGYGAVAVAVILAGVILGLLLKRRRQAGERLDYITPPGESLEEAGATREPEVSDEERERARVMSQLQKLAREKPKEAAKLLRSWLNEESR